VTIQKSVTPDFIICLEDGKKYKTLKRHLRGSFNLSPHEYRVKWSLPHDYPMVAPNYAAIRSELAKSIGLGNMRQKAKQAATARKTPAVRKSVPKPGKKSTLFMKAAKGR
jgi:predicted transcriptional regulator